MWLWKAFATNDRTYKNIGFQNQATKQAYNKKMDDLLISARTTIDYRWHKNEMSSKTSCLVSWEISTAGHSLRRFTPHLNLPNFFTIFFRINSVFSPSSWKPFLLLNNEVSRSKLIPLHLQEEEEEEEEAVSVLLVPWLFPLNLPSFMETKLFTSLKSRLWIRRVSLQKESDANNKQVNPHKSKRDH